MILILLLVLMIGCSPVNKAIPIQTEIQKNEDLEEITIESGCPIGMIQIRGEYCPAVIEQCTEHHKEYLRALKGYGNMDTVSERCLHYSNPSRCLSKNKIEMNFCMDQFEWPNVKGELPLTLISWKSADESCKSVGKRLCTEDEFNFACEGEEILPYSYGYDRNDKICNIDQPYIERVYGYKPYEKCMQDPKCQIEYKKIDPAGSKYSTRRPSVPS